MLWIRPLMPGLTEKLLLCFALAAVGAGCKPQVGDDCKVSRDCSAAGDRLCDITAPGGYCTVFNCEPNSCPDGESLCVQFGAVLSPACPELTLPSPSPYARTFCMATCDDDGDCRSGYTCEDLSNTNPWGAVLIDLDRGNKACVVPFTGDVVEPGGNNDVCKALTPSEASAGGEGGQGAEGE
jgi:hypothetical protein